MKLTRSHIFYLLAFAAVSYFLWVYLNAPRSFIISLIISLAIILVLVSNDSKFTKPIGGALIIVHAIRIIGYFIPTYENKPDIRQRYRRSPSVMQSVGAGTGNANVSLENNNSRIFTIPRITFFDPQPIYQGNTISIGGSLSQTENRMGLALRDGTLLQLFPQSSLTLQELAPDFASLTGSRVGVLLEQGITSMHVRRTNYLPSQQYIKASNIFFSCKACIIAVSGPRGSISSSGNIVWRTEGGEEVTVSGGTYTFQNSSLRRSEETSLSSLLKTTTSTFETHRFNYDTKRQEFIEAQRGRSMDTSILLASVSKVKMALVGLFDRTYREKYDNLALYEYLRDSGETIPPPFASSRHLYEFIK